MNAANSILKSFSLPQTIDPQMVKSTLAQMKDAAPQLDNQEGVDRDPAQDIVDIRQRNEDGTGKKLVLDQSNPDSVKLTMVQKWTDGARKTDVIVTDEKTSVNQQDFVISDGKPFPTNHSFISFS